ncbi:MAG: carboxy terminal-processing peptidase [Bacteroidota bacterium]
MKFRFVLFSGLLAAGLLFVAFYPPVDNSEKEAVLIQTINTFLSRFHYAPQDIDDQFSEKAFDIYIDRLDGARRWLTAEDFAFLESFKDQIDDQSNAGYYEFFDQSVALIEQGIARSQQYYREILAEPFDFNVDESVEMDGEKRDFASSEAELKEYWREFMKYETLTRLADKLEEQEKGEDPELAGKSVAELEEEARADVLKTFDDYYERLQKRKRTYYLSTYINSITNVFDPHTSYFEPIEKQNFDINMSGKLEGIGARLQSDGNYTKITSVIVGGPAWKQGDLKENDKIVKVAQDGEDPIDVTGMQLDDVVSKIRGEKGTKVTLTVKKIDGSMTDIEIVRDVVILEEGFAKSLILHTTAKEKVGFISLPRFYDDFYDEEGRSCARDVAQEIEKLKKENVRGIILDLRNNGGGSLRDVVTMSGFFIEKGPIVQVKARGRSPEVLEDNDPSVKWDGHLIVMVNQFSASASEILAAALQDYERAVIVGSTSTFGKGTVQRFYNLDRAIPGYSELKPFGEIKLTTQKFYRIDGGSTQLKGVTPDIILPDMYSYIETGEKEQEYPMNWTQIAPVPHEQNVRTVNKIDVLKEKSAYRIQNSDVLQKIDQNAKQLHEQREDTDYPLSLEAFQLEQDELSARADAFEKLFENDVNYGVSNLPVDEEGINNNESKKARNDEWIDDIKKDVHLKEVLNIMHDMIAGGLSQR